MKIAIIRHSIRNWGADRLIFNHLSFLVERGHTVEYWTNRLMTDYKVDPRIEIKQIPIPGQLGTIFFSLTKKFKSDIVLVDLVFMACVAWIRNRKKVVYLGQDYDITYYKFAPLIQFIHFCYSTALKRLKIFTIAVSDHLASHLKRYTPKHLVVISNGVDLNQFRRTENSKFLPERTKPFSILLFARIDKRKGRDVAEKAFRKLLEIRPQQDWQIWVIGKEDINVPGADIKHFGFLKTDEELRQLLSAADIFLIPSRSEGLSLLLLQALACQCMVVSTEVSSIIQTEKDGLLSPIEDFKALASNLNRLMNDPELQSTIKNNARKLAESFSMKKSSEAFETALLNYSSR